MHAQCVLVSSPASAWCLTEEERSWAVQRKRVADEAAAAADPASTCAWRAAPMPLLPQECSFHSVPGRMMICMHALRLLQHVPVQKGLTGRTQ